MVLAVQNTYAINEPIHLLKLVAKGLYLVFFGKI